MKHRSKEEIAALVLEAIVNTHRPTQTMIMYKAYLTCTAKGNFGFFSRKGLNRIS